ncbi:hypothetical protein CFOL_v3_13153 [Cephalotus follicularis]|uniref:Uncharacterized protein n=1 Tax=Cephalotus follicularis TaxID=3775 RepID=A0A1Q3BP68_CEPFO|nr:hypothetical protein CFOL_v3_13153 [Cephalotus follicularis]
MAAMEASNPGSIVIWQYFSRKWTLLYDQGRRWGDMTINMVEIFNGVLKGARGLPITALV